VVVTGERLAVDKALALLEARVAALQAEFSHTAASLTSSQALAYKGSAVQKQTHGEKEKKTGVAVEKKINVVLDSRGRGGFIGKAGSAIHVIEKLSACRVFVREGFILVTGTQFTCFTSTNVQILPRYM